LFLVTGRGQVHFSVVSSLSQFADVHLSRRRSSIALKELAFFATLMERGGVIFAFDVAGQARAGIVSDKRFHASFLSKISSAHSVLVVVVRKRVFVVVGILSESSSDEKANKKFHFFKQDFFRRKI